MTNKQSNPVDADKPTQTAVFLSQIIWSHVTWQYWTVNIIILSYVNLKKKNKTNYYIWTACYVSTNTVLLLFNNINNGKVTKFNRNILRY